ncbi:MAG: FAD-containing oxidoreductase [Chloroflexi bacterium]|nr:FAD-containing oxidoreductase [Chloroflexota bacterium]
MSQAALEQYDAIVIGAGQSGGPLSTALARDGRKTALIERKWVGGSCINSGCTPTKTMAASARVAYLARRAGDYGVDAGTVTVDMAKVRRRTQALVDSFRSGSQGDIEGTEGVDLVFGEASFTGPHTVEVRLQPGGTRALTAPLILINTGLRPSDPPVPGLDLVPTLDSTAIQELETVPDHLMVLGGGYIGVEFAQMFRRFGAMVTVIEPAPQLLGQEDPDVAEEVAKILREDGIEVLLQATPLRVQAASGGRIQLTIRTQTGERTLTGTHLLKAAGRVPDTDALNVAAAGVKTQERGFIQVDDRLETNVPGIYAMGDVKGGPAFTHISYDDFRVLRANLLDSGNATTAGRLVPYTVFMDPQMARVGLTETQARAQGRKIRVAKMPMSYVARALELDESRGLMKAVVDVDSGEILGCAILGIEGGEVMAMVQIAMMGHLPYTTLRDAIFTHPTLAESLNSLFGALE